MIDYLFFKFYRLWKYSSYSEIAVYAALLILAVFLNCNIHTIWGVLEQYKILLLEIDPPGDVISKHRKKFYERCGFVQNSFSHIHPPYHKENGGHSLLIMSCPKQISQSIFDAFNQYLKNKVMKNVFM